MRAILVRDTIAGWLSRHKSSAVRRASEHRIRIASGPRRLDARLSLPPSPAASVLILHGIGERLGYWQDAQQLLAQHGVASLIFHYSGYGRSAGATTPANLRQDTVAAYAELQRLVPDDRPPFLLGLSLGTGIAIDAAPHLEPPASGVILCEAFTSLRDAAGAVGDHIPLPPSFIRRLARLMPHVYRTAASIGLVKSPLLIVHSDADELFPVAMAREILAAAQLAGNREAQIFVPTGFAHNDAFARPSLDYWQPILDFLLRRPEAARAEAPGKR